MLKQVQHDKQQKALQILKQVQDKCGAFCFAKY